MKTNRQIFLGLLVLGFLFCDALASKQDFSEKQLPSTVDLISQKIGDSIVRIESDIGYGTGFFIAPDKIVTNIHVIAGFGTFQVKSVGKETVWSIEGVIAFDKKNDLAILKISGAGTPLHLGNSDMVQSGESIFTVESSINKYKIRKGTINGILESGKRLRMKVDITPGDSGAPVFNSKKQVIGVNAISGRFYKYAISSNVLKALIAQTGMIEPIVQWNKRKFVRAHAYYDQGKIKYAAKNYKGAIVDFDVTIHLEPDFSIAYFNRGRAKYNLGNFEGAMIDFEKGVKLNPEYAAAYHLMGVTSLLLIDYKAAITYVDKAIKLAPEYAEYAESYNIRGAAKYQLEDYDGAIDDFNKAIEINPGDANTYNSRGHVRIVFGNSESKQGNLEKAQRLYKKAITDFDKAIQIDPENAYYYYERGRAKEALGQKEAAQVDFDKAKKLDPDVGK